MGFGSPVARVGSARVAAVREAVDGPGASEDDMDGKYQRRTTRFSLFLKRLQHVLGFEPSLPLVQKDSERLLERGGHSPIGSRRVRRRRPIRMGIWDLRNLIIVFLGVSVLGLMLYTYRRMARTRLEGGGGV